MSEPKKFPQYFACIIAALIAFPAGVALGWINPIVNDLLEGKYGFDVSIEEYSWIAASLPLGGLISSIPSGFFIDFVGRHLTLILVVLPQVVGWFLIRIARNVWFIYVGRFLVGMMCGTIHIVVPIYVAEIAQQDNRDIFCMLFNVLLYGGLLFIYSFGVIMDPKSLSVLGIVMPMIVSISAMILPKTPVYLMQKGKENQTNESLKILRGSQYDTSKEIISIKDDLETWTKERKTFFQSIKSRASAKALYISCGLMCFQQLCGLGLIKFYTEYIFDHHKINSLEPRFEITFIGCFMFGTMFIQMFVIQKLGRRIFLMISAAIIAVCHLILGVYFLCVSKEQKWTHDCNWLPLVLICVCCIGVSLGLGSIPWIMITELFPPDIRGVAISISLTVFWALHFIITKLYFNIETSGGTYIVFFFFAGAAVLALLFIFIMVPETRGKSVNEILEVLEDKIK